MVLVAGPGERRTPLPSRTGPAFPSPDGPRPPAPAPEPGRAVPSRPAPDRLRKPPAKRPEPSYIQPAAHVQAPPAHRLIQEWRGPIPAQIGAGPPNPWVWWLGVHGGAGASTLTTLVDGSGDARRMLPSDPSQRPWVVAVARTHRSGLEAAQDLAAQARAGLVPQHGKCIGLVTVADAPGPLPPTLRRFRKLVEAAYARTWRVPWIPEWREAAPTPGSDLPPAIRGLAKDLAELLGRA